MTDATNAGGSVYNYTETETGITYDKNGNIKALTRGSTAGNIEQLSYDYGSTPSNRLCSISDGSGKPAGVNTGLTGNCTYDGNGNMTRDMGRNATFTHNYLNLPSSVKIGSATAFSYEYDASGNKYKYVADSTSKYGGGFEYNQNKKFRRLAVTDGRLVLRNGQTLEFNYYLKDHLGNVRVVFDDVGKVLQRTDYYPFGMSISRSGSDTINRYLSNGKEKQLLTGYLDMKPGCTFPKSQRGAQLIR